MDIPLRFNVPPITRSVVLAFVALTCVHAYLSFLEDDPSVSAGLPYLCLIPGLSWGAPWTLITATLINREIINLVLSGLTLFFAGRYFERAWGSSEYTKFLILLAVVPNAVAASLLVLIYLVTGSEDALYSTINGTVALQAAFLVAFKQLIPEHTVDLFKSTVRVRVKHFPALFVLLSTALSPLPFVLYKTFSATMLVWLGFLTSWVYLRFYRIDPSSTRADQEPMAITRGDASDTFAFSHFFPDAIQTIIDPACEAVYQLCLRFKVVPPFSSDAVVAGGLLARQHAAERGAVGAGPGSSQKALEAERRRALALKALDQKLNESSSTNGANAAGPASLSKAAMSNSAAPAGRSSDKAHGGS